MSSVFFNSASRIIKSVFDWLQTSDQGKTSNLIMDTFQSGIDKATLAGEGFTLVPGLSVLSVTVQGQGIAYDSNSNRIFIASTDTTLYNVSNVTATTNDGLGNFILTPQSSGCVNVPLTPSTINYLWVDYLATTDTSVFTLNKVTEAKIFYKLTDGYYIRVTTVNTPPNSASVFLGTIDLTSVSSGIISSSTITQSGRQYFNVLPNIVPITTAQANRSNATAIYNPNSTYILDTHVKAVGTGTVSAINPHGTSIEDLGVSVLDTVTGHRQLEHGVGGGTAAANAIIAGVPGTPSPSTSAMAALINIVDPGSDYLTIYQLLSTEFAIVNGTAFNVTTIFGAIPANANIFFTSLTSGVYNVYWDSVVKSFSVTTSDISSDVSKLWLCSITWTLNFSPGYNHLSGLVDRRRIGSTTHILQRWLTSARPGSGLTSPTSGEFGFNLSTNSMEYWDGTIWQQPVNSSSNATVPTGSVLPFAGTSAPSGFLLANGSAVSRTTYASLFAVISTIYGSGDGSTTFNLPNLINNAPIGAGSLAALGAAVGAASHTLTSSEIPTTSLSITATDSGHTHSISDPGHNHSQNSHNHSVSVIDPGHSHNARGSGLYSAGGGSALDNAGTANAFTTAIQSNTTGITASANGTTATNNSNTTGISATNNGTANITASGSVNGGGSAHSIIQPSLGLNFIIKS